MVVSLFFVFMVVSNSESLGHLAQHVSLPHSYAKLRRHCVSMSICADLKACRGGMECLGSDGVLRLSFGCFVS